MNLAVQPGWHIYAEVPPGSAHTATTVELKLPDGVIAEGSWRKPGGLPAPNNPNALIYTGLAKFSQTIVANDVEGLAIEVVVTYEVCNADYCLPVGTVREVISTADGQ